MEGRRAKSEERREKRGERREKREERRESREERRGGEPPCLIAPETTHNPKEVLFSGDALARLAVLEEHQTQTGELGRFRGTYWKRRLFGGAGE